MWMYYLEVLLLNTDKTDSLIFTHNLFTDSIRVPFCNEKEKKNCLNKCRIVHGRCFLIKKW